MFSSILKIIFKVIVDNVIYNFWNEISASPYHKVGTGQRESTLPLNYRVAKNCFVNVVSHGMNHLKVTVLKMSFCNSYQGTD